MMFPKDPKPVRSEDYRRLVASLDCIFCGRGGASQACHPNSSGLILGRPGKMKGRKACDLLCFPAGHEFACGHHKAYDEYRLEMTGGKARQAEMEPILAQMTQEKLIAMSENDQSIRRILFNVGLLEKS